MKGRSGCRETGRQLTGTWMAAAGYLSGLRASNLAGVIRVNWPAMHGELTGFI
jgi:hypothetical protein